MEVGQKNLVEKPGKVPGEFTPENDEIRPYPRWEQQAAAQSGDDQTRPDTQGNVKKIEFSRRGMGSSVVFEAVDPLLIRDYQLGSIMANHYDADSALRQKIGALVGRRATQARDLFDIHLLINSGVKVPRPDNPSEAREKAFAISFATFKSQVLSYLHPDYLSQYDSDPVWDDIVVKIGEAFEVGES